MDKYGYLDHTNPQTGTCAFSLKSEYGLTSNEYVAENAFGFSSSTGNNYYSGIERMQSMLGCRMEVINTICSIRILQELLLVPSEGIVYSLD
jgi:hypothetical protein